MLKTITGEELLRQMQSANPPVVLEALPERYYLQQHLPGARLFPHDQVEQLAPVVVPDKSAPIVVYCASRTCQNSQIAANRLLRLGYTEVSVYEAGKQGWEEAGLPFETAVPAADAIA